MTWMWRLVRHLPRAIQVLLLAVTGYVTLRLVADNLLWLTIAAVLLWAVAAAGLLHAAGMLPNAFRGTWIMDPLDRLTNKSALFAGLSAMGSVHEKQVDGTTLAATLASHVFGQDEVCRDVAVQIKVRFAKTARTEPVGVFLMAGPPATGKTLFAKVLSDALYGPGSLFHVEMAQFAQPHMIAQLFGQAKGYAGSDTHGKLTGALRDRADRVILLDEFEKAHKEVHSRFLSAWNDGFVTEGSGGQHYPTTDAVFILTTNAKQREIEALQAQFAGDRRGYSDACKRTLQDVFAPEVLSRIDRVFPFLPLGREDVARIVATRIEAIVRQYDLAIDHIDFRILLRAVGKAAQRKADAREIARIVEGEIGEELADLKGQGIRRVRLVPEDDRVRAVPA